MKKNYSFWCLSGAMLLFTLSAVAAAASPPQPYGLARKKAMPLDRTAADRYAGYYQIGPQRAVHFWRKGPHFYFGRAGTPQRIEIFPETSTRFFLAHLPITFTFNVGSDGKITGLTIDQAGRRILAPRITAVLARSFPPPGAAAAAKSSVPRTWHVMTGVTPKYITPPTIGVIDYWPCFSPDGKVVLFSRTRNVGKTWALFRVPVGGGEAKLLARLPVSATRPSWSARTNRIVFNGSSPDGKHSGIWEIDADGRDPHLLSTPGIIAPSYPSWYPDGRTIGFVDFARNILYRINVDGGMPVAITHQNNVLAGMSSVSPDGRRVVFAGQKNIGQVYDQNNNEIWLSNDSGVSRPVESKPLPGRAPSWSPDGKRIAFESNRGSSNGLYAIFLINRDGTGLVQVTDYTLNANHPAFSPDGRRLVFAMGDPAKKEENIAVVRLPPTAGPSVKR